MNKKENQNEDGLVPLVSRGLQIRPSSLVRRGLAYVAAREILEENIHDLSIIGMAKYGKLLAENSMVDFLAWEGRMLSDSDLVRRSLEQMTPKQLQNLYLRSRALYIGYENIFENGAQEFDVWSSYLLSQLGEDERKELGPHCQNIYQTILSLDETSGLEDLSKYDARNA